MDKTANLRHIFQCEFAQLLRISFPTSDKMEAQVKMKTCVSLQSNNKLGGRVQEETCKSTILLVGGW